MEQTESRAGRGAGRGVGRGSRAGSGGEEQARGGVEQAGEIRAGRGE